MGNLTVHGQDQKYAKRKSLILCGKWKRAFSIIITFIVIIGGLIIIFFYITRISSNTQFLVNNKKLIPFSILVLLTIYAPNAFENKIKT